MTTFPRQAGHPLLSLSLPSFLVQRYPHTGHFHAYSLFIRSSKLSGTPFCSESHIALSLSSSPTASLMLSNGKSQRRSFSICASLNSPFPRCLFRLCIKLPCSLAVIGLSVWHLVIVIPCHVCPFLTLDLSTSKVSPSFPYFLNASSRERKRSPVSLQRHLFPDSL